MAPNTSIIAKLLHVNGIHIENVEVGTEIRLKDKQEYKYEKIVVNAKPIERMQRLCPCCRQQCPKYDVKSSKPSKWRGPNLNGILVEISYQPTRIKCPNHGIITEYIPWQDGTTRFLPDFNNEVTYLALTSPKTVVSEYMSINWRTVENCIKATHDRIEPDQSVRLHGLRRICVDETSYKKGHKYITVVYDMDKNRVIWLSENHGKEIFSEFCRKLSEEERSAIEVVAGDGARWIDECVKEFFPKAKRCVDFFHVAVWVTEALDRTRLDVTRQANQELLKVTKAEQNAKFEKERVEKECRDKYLEAVREVKFLQKKKGRPSKKRKELETFIAAYEADQAQKKAEKDQEKEEKKGTTGIQLSVFDQLTKTVSNLKGTKYALGMNPDNLSQQNRDKLALIEASCPDLYKAYQLKERIRAILHCKDVSMARKELIQWIADAKNSGLKEFDPLADKIERHLENILCSVECQANSAKSESTNTTIKSIIKTARGFVNLENMFALIMLRCSDLVVPLYNRYQPTPEILQARRELANQRKAERLEANTLTVG